MHSQNHPKWFLNLKKNIKNVNGFFNHFLCQNGLNMDPKREPKLRTITTWARWTANGRPMGPQNLQNGAQWNPQSSQNGPLNSQNGVLETPTSQNGPQNCQNEALKNPKASESTQAKMTKLTLNRKH